MVDWSTRANRRFSQLGPCVSRPACYRTGNERLSPDRHAGAPHVGALSRLSACRLLPASWALSRLRSVAVPPPNQRTALSARWTTRTTRPSGHELLGRPAGGTVRRGRHGLTRRPAPSSARGACFPASCPHQPARAGNHSSTRTKRAGRSSPRSRSTSCTRADKRWLSQSRWVPSATAITKLASASTRNVRANQRSMFPGVSAVANQASIVSQGACGGTDPRRAAAAARKCGSCRDRGRARVTIRGEAVAGPTVLRVGREPSAPAASTVLRTENH